MPAPPFPDDVRALLDKPNPAVVATVREDGHPVTVPTWYLLDEAGWYTHVSVVGRVVEMADDEGLAGIDRLSQHYTGRPYPNRDSPRVNAWIEVDRWHGWGAAKTD